MKRKHGELKQRITTIGQENIKNLFISQQGHNQVNLNPIPRLVGGLDSQAF